MITKKYVKIKNKKVPLIRGKKGCFARNTLISTPNDGHIPIQDIRVGQKVLSFDSEGNIHIDKVIQCFKHNKEKIIKVTLWQNIELFITSNHWVLNEYNTFSEIGNLEIDDVLIGLDENLLPIINIEEFDEEVPVYNITVEKYHTYFANGVRVHNKGGNKGGATVAPGVEDPNTLFSTDVLFLTVAGGEGPIYRINPNGPQDIEINEGSIDDLLNMDGDGLTKNELFHTESTTGTLTQDPLPIFGEESATPQSMSQPVILKKGNIAGVPESKITLQNTSVGRWDSLSFIFSVNALQKMDNVGNVSGYSASIKISIYDSTGATFIDSITKTINGKTNVPFRFTVEIPIPASKKSDNGYKFTIEKTSNDSDSSKIQDVISFIAWIEKNNDEHAYPRTSLIGYALKAAGQHTGGVPTFTHMQKGLLCKVPSNYDQPILNNGDIDWREIEVPTSGSNSYTNKGYRLQSSGKTILTAANPIIYKGLWDGTFKFNWTQNPIWILYDLLINKTYGLGIPEANIDKFRFYKIAQYCDGVNSITGAWTGVSGFADGTYRYKPRGTFTKIREILIGLTNGTAINERRFICDIVISTQKQVIDIINVIAGMFRGILFYSGGKITLNVDLPDETPVAIFNETNIEKESLLISGIKETDILTGVEVSYIEPKNHFRREVLRIDDAEALNSLNQIENIAQIDLPGVTRRGQAMRFAQYLLASSKYIRRKIKFRTSAEAINLTIGDIIAVSQQAPGTSWGYGGRVAKNASITTANSNVVIEHFTSPAISDTVFTSNTLPLALRIIGKNNDRVDLYLLSNTAYTSNASGNTFTGSDIFEVQIISRYKNSTKSFSTINDDIEFKSNNVPTRGDLWTLGEMNPNQFYTAQNDKLFKITTIERDENEFVSINASEYVSNVYTDSDSLINYEPVKYEDTFSTLIPPPAPILNIRPKLVRTPTGAVRNDLEIYVSTDTSYYPLNITTELEHAAPIGSKLIEGLA